jgi:hypothetical protein
MSKNFISAPPERVFLCIIGTKVLRLLLHDIHSHLHQRILLSLYTVKNALKGGKLDRKPYLPFGSEKAIQNNQPMKETQVCS